VVGLVAYRLLWAGKGSAALQELDADLSTELSSWKTILEDVAELDEKDGLVEIASSDALQIYSVGLLRFVEHCLRYLPASRPSLAEMKTTIDLNINRLGRLYGAEIRKGQDEIAEDHRVYLTNEVDKWRPFAIGQDYEPPRKRRKITLDAAADAEYSKIFEDWNNATVFPRPEMPTHAAVLLSMAARVRVSAHQEINELHDDASYKYSYDYLMACLKARTAPDAPVDIITEYTSDDFLPSFGATIKTEVICRIADLMIPELLEDESLSEQHDAIRVLQQVVRWATFVLGLDAEPTAPELKDKTEMHRAFRDWIFIQPSGAF
jgi:hypothetical protein